MNGQVYKYVSGGVDYIIKYDNFMRNITHTKFYSDSNNDVIDGAILYKINKIFAGCIDKLKSISSITVDYNRFSHLLENYIDNYNDIINFLRDISDNEEINIIEAELCFSVASEIKSIVIKSILLFLNTTFVYFKDIKYIINSIYDKYIEQFNSSVISKFGGTKNNTYYQKYMKYKNKYLQLKNIN
jgi:hypothetical protein